MTGAPCAAFRPSQARVLCASAPLPEPRALLLWPGPHRQLRPLRVSPRRAVQARQAARSTPDCKPGRALRVCVISPTAQAEEPSEQGEGGDDEDQAWFVCPFRVCSEVASKTARRDVEEQAASAQTTDLVEDAPKASERAVGLRFCFWFRRLWPLPAGAGRAAAEERGGSSQNRKQMCLANGKSTGKHPCTRQDLDQRVRRLAIDEMETALQAVKTQTEAVNTLTALRLEERKAGRSDKANTLNEELNEAKKELAEAKKELAEAKKELAEAEYNAKASVQAGRGQAGGLLRVQLLLLTMVCSTPACVFVQSTIVGCWGHALLSARIPLFVKLFSLCWLAEWPVLRSLSGCGCFCLRLDLQVTVSVRGSQGSQPCVLRACL